jgi:tetraacyldisaccharide 4'-kinase
MPLDPPRWWYDPAHTPAWSVALRPLADAYNSGVKRRFRVAEPYRSPLPVICIGNLTMGGAGKTPLALHVAEVLQGMGLKPGFLSRGYGGRERGPLRVDARAHTARDVGDEPLLLARTAPAVVSRDRRLGAQSLEGLGVDVIVMDDGFQNPALLKDLCLVAVDGAAGVGNGKVFPRGPLRADLSFQLPMADAFVVIGEGPAFPFLSETGKPVLHATFGPSHPPDAYAGRWIAFCGIGRPAKFFATLRGAGIDIAAEVPFPDHHAFTRDDERRLLALAAKHGAGLLTTEKDQARLWRSQQASALARAAQGYPVRLAFPSADALRLRSVLEQMITRRKADTPTAVPV